MFVLCWLSVLTRALSQIVATTSYLFHMVHFISSFQFVNPVFLDRLKNID